MFIGREPVCFKCPPCCSVLLESKKCVDEEVIFAFAACEAEAIRSSTRLEVEVSKELNMCFPIRTFIEALLDCGL